MKFKKKWCVEEPMHCWKRGCKEELNGLMYHTIDFGEGFVFQLWLCKDCADKFEKLKEERK